MVTIGKEENGMIFRSWLYEPTTWLVLAFLLVFGISYNALVAQLESMRHDRGYTAFLVVGGCLVTLAGGSMLAGFEMGAWFTACFAASGLPMVIGSWARNSRARVAEEKKVADLAKEMLNDAEETERVCDQCGDCPRNQCEWGGQESAAAHPR
jgi:hypothetical protein